jgi:biopolymer transport protein ExbD
VKRTAFALLALPILFCDAQAGQPDECGAGTLKIRIAAHHTFYWNGTKVHSDLELQKRMDELGHQSGYVCARIFPDKSADYNDVVHVMMLAQKTRNVSFGFTGISEYQ